MRYLLTRTPARVILALVLVLVTSVLVVRATDFTGEPVDARPTPTAEVAEATASPTATPTDTPAATPSPTEEPAPTFKLNGGGAKNIVLAKNNQDGRFLVRGRLDLNRVGAPKVAPVNLAYALGMCTDCNTLAIAGQITMYKRGVNTLAAPQNAAVAVNAGCVRCFTGAIAIQYLIPVDNMNEVPRDVDALVRDLNHELHTIEQDASHGAVTVQQAIDRLNSVLARFDSLGQYLNEQSKIESNADTPSPYPSPPPEASESPTSEAATDVPSDSAEPAATETPASP